ncbi:hypothetical protein F5Y15DRAFT_413371 [Xylariaceae sp. FL0016]|nr:hypothetical protein F5Y15DRAFT_413371 [Xylariaceae sp. FL0016]
MSRYFPHTSYEEDQPLARTILTTHVLTRGITTGALIGAGIYGGRSVLSRTAATTSPSPAVAHSKPLLPKSAVFLRLVGKSTVWTLGIVGLGLVGRIWGREDIEWRDRSWRLLENKGQLETDDWTYGGMAAAAVVTAVRRPLGLGWVGVLGALGMGSVGGMVGYMGWRYGVHQGKFSGNARDDSQ